MDANPVASGLNADIASACMGVHEETVICCNHHFMKTTFFKLMDCNADAFKRIGNLSWRSVRVILKVAVYFHRTQHQQIDFR